MIKEIKTGHTNKRKYKDGNTFVLEKTKNEFNHEINYSLLSEFDFVPKLISQDKDKLVWEWIEGELLTKPTDEDLVEMGRMVRTLHKSDAKFPKNNYRKRIMAYLRTINDKGVHVPEIHDNYREFNKLINRMGRLNPLHNDIWWENIIKDKNGKLWLVDWEYGTMGDKHFDLAFFISSSNLDEKQEKIFLDSYNSHDDYNAYIDEWMVMYKRFVAYLTLCWGYAQDKMPFDMQDLKDYLNKTKK